MSILNQGLLKSMQIGSALDSVIFDGTENQTDLFKNISDVNANTVVISISGTFSSEGNLKIRTINKNYDLYNLPSNSLLYDKDGVKIDENIKKVGTYFLDATAISTIAFNLNNSGGEIKVTVSMSNRSFTKDVSKTRDETRNYILESIDDKLKDTPPINEVIFDGTENQTNLTKNIFNSSFKSMILTIRNDFEDGGRLRVRVVRREDILFSDKKYVNIYNLNGEGFNEYIDKQGDYFIDTSHIERLNLNLSNGESGNVVVSLSKFKDITNFDKVIRSEVQKIKLNSDETKTITTGMGNLSLFNDASFSTLKITDGTNVFRLRANETIEISPQTSELTVHNPVGYSELNILRGVTKQNAKINNDVYITERITAKLGSSTFVTGKYIFYEMNLGVGVYQKDLITGIISEHYLPSGVGRITNTFFTKDESIIAVAQFENEDPRKLKILRKGKGDSTFNDVKLDGVTGAKVFNPLWQQGVAQEGISGTIIMAEWQIISNQQNVSLKLLRSTDDGLTWNTCHELQGYDSESDNYLAGFAHFHNITNISEGGVWIASTGDAGDACSFWLSVDDGVTWSLAGQGAKFRSLSLMPSSITGEVFWATEGSGSGVYKGVIDFATKKITDVECILNTPNWFYGLTKIGSMLIAYEYVRYPSIHGTHANIFKSIDNGATWNILMSIPLLKNEGGVLMISNVDVHGFVKILLKGASVSSDLDYIFNLKVI